MPAELEKLKQANTRAIKTQAGIGYSQPTGTKQQNQTVYHAAELLGLPLELDEWNSLQVLDAGANFGKFYFMVGFSIAGGSDIIRPS